MAGCQGVGTANYQLSVTAPAGGTVTSNPPGISCPGTCAATYTANTQVTLTAAASPNYLFMGWSGACSGVSGTCNVTLSAAQSVAAQFISGFGLTVTLAGTGGGTVTSSPAGINCTTGSCVAGFPQNTQVTLTETPESGSIFSGWDGACTGTTTCSITLSASSSVTANFGPVGTIANLDHIILFAQENRSLDHYFGQMQAYWAANGYGQSGQTFDGLPQTGTPPSVAGCASGTSGNDCTPDPTVPVSSFHFQSVCQENQSPFWNEAHNQWDYADPAGTNPNDLATPPLNGFAFTAAYDAGGNGFMDVLGIRSMGYFDGNDLNYYYYLASNFATSDRWFAPVMSRTQVNRMYILSATSYGHAYPIGQGLNNGQQLPVTPILEALQSAGITWKVYVDPANIGNVDGSCSSETGTQQEACLVENSYINQFTYEGTILNSPTLEANFAPISQFAIDAANNALPQFALIEPASSAGLDEHPADSDEYPVNVQSGENYAATKVINPLMQSPSWSSSALIFTYDEWGGYYDHVPPQPATPPGDFDYPTDLNPAIHDICTGTGELGNGMCTFGWTGYRVPMIVISPFANKNYVSHTVRDTTAVLNFVEERFGVKPLTARDAAQPSMDEFFNFANPPWMTPPNPPTPNQYGSSDCTLTPPASWGEPPAPADVLTVAVSGNGSVSSNPVGINCTPAGGSNCSANFANDTAVTLTASPPVGGTFAGWSGGGCTGAVPTCSITLTTSETVTATFQ